MKQPVLTPIESGDIRLLTGSFKITSHSGTTTAGYRTPPKQAKAVVFLGDVDMRKGRDVAKQLANTLKVASVASYDNHFELLRAAKTALAFIQSKWPVEHGQEDVAKAWSALEQAITNSETV